MFKFVLSAAAVLFASAVCISSVHAQDMSNEDYVKSRIAQYREIGTWFKAISDEMKRPEPRPSTIRTAALGINRLAKRHYGWFRAGSGPESGEKTKAKAVIWSRPQEFKAAQDRFMSASTAFLNAANSTSDPKTLGPQFKALGQSCANCHDTFRRD